MRARSTSPRFGPAGAATGVAGRILLAALSMLMASSCGTLPTQAPPPREEPPCTANPDLKQPVPRPPPITSGDLPALTENHQLAMERFDALEAKHLALAQADDECEALRAARAERDLAERAKASSAPVQKRRWWWPFR